MAQSSVESLGKIAVVGMAGRYPGSRTIEQFWDNLKHARECISFFTNEELLNEGVEQSLLARPDYVKARGAYQGTYLFDASFFGYTPREAELLDPQQRAFLECSWEALEDAGYDPITYSGRIGVFAGSGPATYLAELASIPEIWKYTDRFTLPTYGEKDFLATRVGYKLNLRGPCITVQTACSTSLVSVVMACQNLLSFCCDIALAGGVTLNMREKAGYIYKEGGIGSPDGHCRTFDADALGTVAGSGSGVVVLKRLEDALTDGDTIHAVVLGTGLNNDGSSRMGFAAPGLEGQVAVASDAIATAGIDPETIGYVECHGTATPIGDPIEIAALTRAFRTYTGKQHFCFIGSVKTNIGHTDTAAGIAGFIKTVLALEHKMIPASLHFRKANPEIDFEQSPFVVNTCLREWPAGAEPRRAGVSSFGLGGTNAHVILEQAPQQANSQSTRPYQMLVLSARSETALLRMGENLAGHMREHSEKSLADIAYTLQVGRHLFPYRRALVTRDCASAIEELECASPEETLTTFREKQADPIALLFPGQGPQYVNMGKELYQYEAVFRRCVDQCAVILKSQLDLDIREVLYPHSRVEEAAAILGQIRYTTPILFTIEYALAQLWMGWGLQPRAMIGHSTGEYAAACIAGVFSLEDALRVVCARGRLMQSQPSGAMTAVLLSEQELVPLLESAQHVSVAAINAPSTCVVSGSLRAMENLEDLLANREVPFRRLHISHASHSEMMDPILNDFGAEVRKAKLNRPQIPYLSNVTGTWIHSDEATDPDYWVTHIRKTVRFSDGVAELLKNGEYIFVETGPGRMLASLVEQHPAKTASQIVVPSLPHPKDDCRSDLAFLLNSLDRLWLEGVPIDWSAFHAGENLRRIPLPTYPFERQHYQLTSKGPDPGAEKSSDAPPPTAVVPNGNGAGYSSSVGCRIGQHTRPKLRTAYIAPRNELENAISELWEEVLGIHGLGVNDSFIALGGNSLIAIQLVSRIRNLFEIEVPLAAFYRQPTIEGMAQTLVRHLIDGVDTSLLEEMMDTLE